MTLISTFRGLVWHITHLNTSQFQSFKPFNRSAPFNALRRFKVQEFKVNLEASS
jgi:hypothetical protein